MKKNVEVLVAAKKINKSNIVFTTFVGKMITADLTVVLNDKEIVEVKENMESFITTPIRSFGELCNNDSDYIIVVKYDGIYIPVKGLEFKFNNNIFLDVDLTRKILELNKGNTYFSKFIKENCDNDITYFLEVIVDLTNIISEEWTTVKMDTKKIELEKDKDKGGNMRIDDIVTEEEMNELLSVFDADEKDEGSILVCIPTDDEDEDNDNTTDKDEKLFLVTVDVTYPNISGHSDIKDMVIGTISNTDKDDARYGFLKLLCDKYDCSILDYVVKNKIITDNYPKIVEFDIKETNELKEIC